MAHTKGSIFWSVVGMAFSGLCGGLAGWASVTLAGWSGTGGAILAAMIGMVVATATWVGLTVLLRTLGLLR